MSALPHQLIKLKKDLKKTGAKAMAWIVIEKYISFFHYKDIKKDLWQMLIATLTNSEVDELEKPINRHNAIFFYEYTLLFMKAVCLLNEQHKKPKRKTGRK